MGIQVIEVNGPAGAFKTFADVRVGEVFKYPGDTVLLVKITPGEAYKLTGTPEISGIPAEQGVVVASNVVISVDY